MNVVGFSVEEYPAVVAGIEEGLASAARGGRRVRAERELPEHQGRRARVRRRPGVVARRGRASRRETRRPVFVKLSPSLPNIGDAARIAADAGADAISVVNTIPGLVIDIERRRPALGFGTGGVSGPAILPVGVLATWKVRKAVSLPILGLGGVSSAEDALQYILAGASLVGVGTAALRDPRAPERIIDGLDAWCRRHGVHDIQTLSGTLEWPSG